MREIFLGISGFLFALYHGRESLVFLILVCVLTYFSGMRIEFGKKKRFLIWSSIILLIGILLYAKRIRNDYILGISYYTLMAIGYLIEVYHGKKSLKNPFKFWICFSFFPLMIQGPITDIHVLYEEITKPKRKLSEKNIKEGMCRVIQGCFKKLVIADRLAPLLAFLFANADNKGLSFFFSLLLYSFRLIMDFTGGIDVVIGIGILLGIRLPENFDKPFLAKSLAEFWNRWHISLSHWFRTYVFYPVSVGLIERKWMKKLKKSTKRRVSVYGATLLTWMLTGLWHGINWSFFLWGLSNAVFLILSYERKQKRKKEEEARNRYHSAFAMLRTFLLVSLLRGFDQYRNPMVFFERIGTLDRSLQVFWEAFEKTGYYVSHLVVLILATLYILWEEYRVKREEGYEKFIIKMAILSLMILIFGAYGKNFEPEGFIYGVF